jgi:adenylosuccinate lyase
MLDVEAALARALAAQRVIPAAAVAPIERACDAGRSTATRSHRAPRSAAIWRFRSSSSSPRW